MNVITETSISKILPTEKLPALFDCVVSNWRAPYGRPTTSSINKINTHLRIVVPESLIEFARKSRHFSSWFSSLGSEFNAPDHIIRTNSRYKQKRMRRGGKWVYSKPRNFVVLNLGFDDDCDCFDTDTFDRTTGEYQIRYWCPSIDENSALVSTCFNEYISKRIVAWAPTRKGEQLDRYKRILEG